MGEMTTQERLIAIVQTMSLIDDLLNVERLILAAWPLGETGRLPGFREQKSRVEAIERARDAFARDLSQVTSA